MLILEDKLIYGAGLNKLGLCRSWPAIDRYAASLVVGGQVLVLGLIVPLSRVVR